MRRIFAETNDLAAKAPKKLKELQDLFTTEAVKYNVLPIDDRSIERFDPGVAGRRRRVGTLGVVQPRIAQ